MRRRTPQEQGRDYEVELAARYGGVAQPNSGAGPRYKLDLKLGGELLFSAKHTTHESYRITSEDLREALAGAQGPGGRGELMAMAIRMAGFPDDVFLLRGHDLMALLQGEVKLEPPAPSKRAAKLAAADRRLA